MLQRSGWRLLELRDSEVDSRSMEYLRRTMLHLPVIGHAQVSPPHLTASGLLRSAALTQLRARSSSLTNCQRIVKYVPFTAPLTVIRDHNGVSA